MSKVEVIQLQEAAILKAMKNRDLEMLDSLLHNDLLFTIPNGQTITKDIDLETYRSGNMEITEITSDQEQIKLIQNLAVVSVIVKMKGSFQRNPFEGKFKVLRVWNFQNDKWQVIAGSSIQL